MSDVTRRARYILSADDQTKGAVSSVQKGMDGIGASALRLAPLISAALGAAVMKSAVDAWMRQEEAIKQVESRLKSTGGVAGQTSQGLQAMAAQLQQITTFGDEAVLEMQSMLLTFTNIRGTIFEDTTLAALNLSTAMGQDLKTSVLQLGKALNDPIRGVTSLSDAGVQFSTTQREQIKVLVESGQTMAAQRVILKELETQFGGAAKAARDTLGGAIQSLQNSFGDALETLGSGGSGFVGAIHELEAVIVSPQFQQGLAGLATGIANVGTYAAKGVAAVSELFTEIKTTAEWLAAFQLGQISFFEWATTGSDDAFVRLQELQRQYGMLENQAGQRFKVPPRPDPSPVVLGASSIAGKTTKAAKDDSPKPFEDPLTTLGQAGVWEFIAQARIDAESRSLAAQIEFDAQRFSSAVDIGNQMQDLWLTQAEEKAAAHQRYLDEEERAELKAKQQKEQIWRSSAASFLSIGASLQALGAGQSRKMFEVSKAASIAGTVIDTYKTAQGAASAVANIPIVGPALAIAASAAAIAAGMARVKAIQSTQFGGSGGGVSAGSGESFGNFSGGGAPITTVDQPKSQVQGPQDITIRLIGGVSDAYVEDEIIPRINNATSKNIRIEFARD